MDIKMLRKQINELMDEYENQHKLNAMVAVKNVLNQELFELIVDEDFIMNDQSEETLREIDQRLIDEFDLDIKRVNKKALVIVMMDNSGSMGIFEKYISGCVWKRLERLFQYKYPSMQFKFILHHTEAKEVSRDEFLTREEMGGTICSSAYRKANELVEEFNYIENDVYVLHISDGDNLPSDTDRTNELVKKLLFKSKFVGYMEINQYNRRSSLLNGNDISPGFTSIDDDKFYYYTLIDKDDVYGVVMSLAYAMFEE